MGRLFVAGLPVEVPFPTVTYRDDSGIGVVKSGAGRDACPRPANAWIHIVGLHTTKGMITTEVRPGAGLTTNLPRRIAHLWQTDGRQASAHLSIDSDGTVGQHADLRLTTCFHAGSINDASVGVEIYQEGIRKDGHMVGAILYACQLTRAIEVCDVLTRIFGIQRQCVAPDVRGIVRRIADGGSSVVGVVGHRHQTTRRGPGDPGDEVFLALGGAGYESYFFEPNKREATDIVTWQARQRDLRITADGIPGPKTVDALKQDGYPDGLWIRR